MKKIRNNWKLKEVLNLFNMPFNELLFEAHNSHIKNHKKHIECLNSVKKGDLITSQLLHQFSAT